MPDVQKHRENEGAPAATRTPVHTVGLSVHTDVRKASYQDGRIMAAILTAEDVVRRIAAECAYVDERGGVGIRLEPAAAIVRQYGEQFRGEPRRKRSKSLTPKPRPLL